MRLTRGFLRRRNGFIRAYNSTTHLDHRLHYLASFNTVGSNNVRDQTYEIGQKSFSSGAAATRPTKPAKRTKRIVVGGL